MHETVECQNTSIIKYCEEGEAAINDDPISVAPIILEQPVEGLGRVQMIEISC
jgi:hypothetical protein